MKARLGSSSRRLKGSGRLYGGCPMDQLGEVERNGVEDPLKWGYSLRNVREILLACLDAVGARSVLEIGAFKGELTADLIAWGADRGARITGIDPLPPEELRELATAHPDFELIESTSHEFLSGLDSLPDAIVLDGDHNYYTLSEELRLIADRAGGDTMPLLLFHDVCWPHARRDTYYAPDRIPEEHRQPLGHDVGLAPGEKGTTEWGLPFVWAALRQGGPRNGTMTAIEDFSVGRAGLRLAVVPAFFGLGVLWPTAAAWADQVATTVDPYDRHPVLHRLEVNRVEHLVAGQARARELEVRARELEALRKRSAKQEAVLRRLLDSSAFAMAEKLSAVRQRGDPAFSRDEVRRVLEDDD